MKAIVVGAGAFGAASADALARRGWDVTVVERWAPGNARGSSGDRTRMLRLGHGENRPEEDAWYIASAKRGIAGWRALAEETGLDLLAHTGLVWLAPAADGVEATVAERLDTAGVAYDVLSLAEVAGLFPAVAVDDLDHGLWEPGAYVIRASAAVDALLARARRHGAELVIGEARPAGPRTVTIDGAPHGADCVVWACGAWLGALLGPVAPVRPAWQDVVYWHAPPAWRGAPAWFDEPARLYGFPDVDGLGAKAVTHEPGPPFDLDRDPRIVRAASVAALERYLARRFPGVGPVLWARVMPYEMTPDGHFVAGAHPERAGEWILGGGSGHGFKHAPALGEHLADLVEGRADPVPMLAPGPR